MSFPQSKACPECGGTMDRRHGTLPAVTGTLVDLRCIPMAVLASTGTYYRCLKNGAHTVIVQREVQKNRGEKDRD
jgi:hypothetical protein